MEKIIWRTQRKYFQEFNIIYSNSAIAFEMVWRRVSGSSNFFVARAVLAFCPFDTAALKINAAALNGRINLSAVRRLFSFAVVRQNGLVIIGERRPLLLV